MCVYIYICICLCISMSVHLHKGAETDLRAWRLLDLGPGDTCSGTRKSIPCQHCLSLGRRTLRYEQVILFSPILLLLQVSFECISKGHQYLKRYLPRSEQATILSAASPRLDRTAHRPEGWETPLKGYTSSQHLAVECEGVLRICCGSSFRRRLCSLGL